MTGVLRSQPTTEQANMMRDITERVADALKKAGLKEDHDVRLALATAAIEAVRDSLKQGNDCFDHCQECAARRTGISMRPWK